MGRLLEVYNTRDILGLRSGPVSCQRVGLFIAPSITLGHFDLRPQTSLPNLGKTEPSENRVDIFEKYLDGKFNRSYTQAGRV